MHPRLAGGHWLCDAFRMVMVRWLGLFFMWSSTCVEAEEPRYASLSKAAAKGDLVDVQLHLKRGADPKALDANGGTALHSAASPGIVDLLIRQGLDVDVQNKAGWTPMHYAVLRKRTAVVQALLAHKADPNVQSTRGKSVLHFCGERNLVDIAKLLLARNAQPGLPDQTGWTPLHYAAVKGHGAMIQLLVAAGADVNAKSLGGGTPLIEAVIGQPREVLQLLLDLGADPAIKEKQGKTALDFAREFKQADAIELLAN